MAFWQKKSKFTPNTVQLNVEKPDPLLKAICDDIKAHPEDYALVIRSSFGHSINRKSEPSIWILSYGLLSSSCIRPNPSAADILCMEAAYTAFIEFQQDKTRRDIAAKLDILDQGRDRLPLTVERAKAAMSRCDQGDIHVAIALHLAEQILPVLAGTHKIVPCDEVRHQYGGDGFSIRVPDTGRDFLTDREWRDSLGNPHRTRALMRAANRAIRVALQHIETATESATPAMPHPDVPMRKGG